MKNLAKAFNAWMYDYIEDPEQFQREMTIVKKYAIQLGEGEEPTYGDNCAATLMHYLEKTREVSEETQEVNAIYTLKQIRRNLEKSIPAIDDVV